jgi:hypothetical protein
MVLPPPLRGRIPDRTIALIEMGTLVGGLFFLFGAKRNVFTAANTLIFSVGVDLVTMWLYDSYTPEEIS